MKKRILKLWKEVVQILTAPGRLVEMGAKELEESRVFLHCGGSGRIPKKIGG